MNARLIRKLPVDLQRYIYSYIPLDNCIICSGIIANYNNTIKNLVCSPYCLLVFNGNSISNMAFYRIAIPIFNFYVTCSYFYANIFIFLFFFPIFISYNLCAVYSLTAITQLLAWLWVMCW